MIPQMAPHQIKEVADEFLQRLEIPEGAKAKPQFCICPIGVVGAGKTTVLKKICQQLPAVRVSADEVRKLLYDKNLPFDDAMFITDEVCQRLKREGYNVAHDGDFTSPISRELLGKSNQGRILELWIRIQPPDEFIISKLTNFKHTYLFKDAQEALANYSRRKELQRNTPDIETLPYLYVFDPSRSDLDEQVAAFVDRARSKLALHASALK